MKIVINVNSQKTNKIFDKVKKGIIEKHNYINSLPFSTKVVLICLCAVLFYNASEIEVTSKENIYPKIQETVLSEISTEKELEEKVEKVKKENFISINSIPILPMIKVKKTTPITDIIKDKKALDFITHNEVLKRAVWVQKTTGLSATTVIGQKGFESGWNSSKLCSKTKNLGNIKCFNKKCQKYNKFPIRRKQMIDVGHSHCIQLYDDYPTDRFIRFNTYWGGWQWYSDLINRVYSKAAKQKSYRQEAEWLRKLGYATDKKYVSKLVYQIESRGIHKLQKYIDEGYIITSKDGSIIFLE